MSKTAKLYTVIILCVVFFFPINSPAETEIICASTTSTENSGLFGHILPLFEGKTGIRVKVVARGTGAAIEMGKRGDADVVFVHAKEQELKTVEDGYFINRHDVMYNDFVIIGPSNDPSVIKGSGSVSDAFGKLARGRASFVSRGDNSGTHTKELSFWKKIGVEPKGQGWYLEVGQGMEKTQRITNEKRAYTLTDRGTWLAAKDKDRLEMAVVFEGDPALFNQYGVMAVNPEKHGHVKYKEALELIKWLTSYEGQQAIADFKDSLGKQLFYPNAD